MSEGSEDLRLFFAVPLAEDLREAVCRVQETLRRCGTSVKWVEPENLHFTLKFLGNLPDSALAELERVAEEVAARHAPFEIRIRGCGAFPRPAEARAVWLAAAEGAQELTALAEDLEKSLAQAGLAAPERRPFKAHATIGRNRTPQHSKGLAAGIKQAAATDLGTMAVGEFALFSSVLTPAGPIYTVQKSFRLG
ncbi:MAG: RNA 2',3'-cyclic phosphodiesterase [Armatimonadetes bacterium]|nr:RNA 2',3'-cyclic phosphodiesterase [Armatimonadota bacterium]